MTEFQCILQLPKSVSEKKLISIYQTVYNDSKQYYITKQNEFVKTKEDVDNDLFLCSPGCTNENENILIVSRPERLVTSKYVLKVPLMM